MGFRLQVQQQNAHSFESISVNDNNTPLIRLRGRSTLIVPRNKAEPLKYRIIEPVRRYTKCTRQFYGTASLAELFFSAKGLPVQPLEELVSYDRLLQSAEASMF
jgi:hypothetical protein